MVTFTCRTCGWTGRVNRRPRCLPCYARRTKEWHKNNPELSRLQKSRYDKKFRKERPDEYRAKKRRYYLPQTARRQRAVRVRWLKSGTVTDGQLREIYRVWQGKCAYCKVPVTPRYYPSDPRGFDHVIPRAKGGKHEKENIVVCCRKCNELKG